MMMTRLHSMQPAFWRGVGRVLDLTGGTRVRLERPGASPAERDARALAGDWANVGCDMRRAIRRVSADVNAVRRAAGDGS